MNPYNMGYDFFVYGTLPLFIVRVAAEVAKSSTQSRHLWNASPGIPLNMIGYDGVHLVGRALSGLFDLACVLLTFVIARRLYGRKVGLLAAAALRVCGAAAAAVALLHGRYLRHLLCAADVLFCRAGGARWTGRDDGGTTSAGGGWLTYVALGASLGASLACRINLAPMAGSCCWRPGSAPGMTGT